MPYENNYNNSGGYGGGRPNYGGPRNSTPRTNNFAPKQTTTGIQLNNEHAGRFLQFDYWGNTVSLSIGATAPGTAITWESKKNAHMTKANATGNDLFEIWDICEDVIESIKNTGTFTSVACKIGSKQDTILEISNGSNLNLSPGIYLVLYKNLDAGNRTGTLDFFPFKSTKVMRGYDHNAGTWKDEQVKLGEFKKFYRAVKAAADALTMAQAHTVASVQYTDKLSSFKAMAAITAALGIDMSKELDAIAKGSRPAGSGGGSGGGGWNRNNGQQNRYGAPRSSAFESNSQQYPSQPSITTSLDDPVDITLDMSELANVDMANFG